MSDSIKNALRNIVCLKLHGWASAFFSICVTCVGWMPRLSEMLVTLLSASSSEHQESEQVIRRPAWLSGFSFCLDFAFFFLWLKASLVTAALYAVCCKKCSWLAGKISAQFLLAVSRRWDGTEEDQWTGEKAHFKINWIDKTPKRMELFAGHDEGFDICVITLTFVNQMCFLPHSERGSF